MQEIFNFQLTQHIKQMIVEGKSDDEILIYLDALSMEHGVPNHITRTDIECGRKMINGQK